MQDLLSSTRRYDIEAIPIIEKYLRTSPVYDLESSLALVKLYQIYPEKCDFDLFLMLLTNSLAKFTTQGFSLSLYMIPEKIQSHESVQALITLSEHLESAQFAEFWTSLTSKKIVKTPDFDAVVRLQILSVLRLAYRKIEKKFFAASIGLEGADLEQFIAANAKQEVLGSEDIVILSDDTSASTKTSLDTLQFSQMTKILQSLQ